MITSFKKKKLYTKGYKNHICEQDARKLKLRPRTQLNALTINWGTGISLIYCCFIRNKNLEYNGTVQITSLKVILSFLDYAS